LDQASPHSNQIILHIDLDCFFAAVEILDNPAYRDKPLIVGADPKAGKGRGVVLTASYPARKFGVHSGQPITQAYRCCPHGIYVPPRGFRYKEISRQVMTIVKQYSPIYESGGLDEAYLDLSEIVDGFDDAEKIGRNLKETVKENVGITCSVGIAFTKTLAKIASDYNKPDGLTVLTPSNYITMLSKVSIKAIPGIGKKTVHFYTDRELNTIGDLYNKSLEEIKGQYGKQGEWAWLIAHGRDNSHVHRPDEEYHQKSISEERTFPEDSNDPKYILSKITQLNHDLHEIITRRGIQYRTVTLKIRLANFTTFNRSFSWDRLVFQEFIALEQILQILVEFQIGTRKIRLIGIKFSNLKENSDKKKQLSLLP
jgi:DNA polymerase IV (DinB-like DNA polymerase)